MISVHGTSDPVVPFTSGTSIFAGIYLYGSSTITARLRSLGVRSYIIPMPGVGHGFPSDPVQNSFWTDTTIVTTARFFYPFVQPTAVALYADETPNNFTLYQNYPNPFNPSTTISFSVARASRVTLKVYDILGREIATLVDGVVGVGRHDVRWNASVAGGVYEYRLVANGSFTAKTMLLLR